jgi:MFS family permease
MPEVSRQGLALATFSSFGNRNFRILTLGSLLAFVGFMVSANVQNVVAFELTGNNRAVGFVAFGQGIAMLFLAPFGGALADRLSKRFVLLVAQSVIGLTFLGLGILLATDRIEIIYLAIGSFITGTMFSLLGPARQALVGDLVEPERRGNAAALTQITLNIARITGPFLAGALIALEAFGTTGAYFVAASLYVVVVATLSLLPATQRRDTQGRSVVADIRLGVRYVAENPRLLPLVLGFILVITVGFSYFTLLPAYVQETMDQPASQYGVLTGVSAIGGLLISLLAAPLADSRRAPSLLVFSGFGLGLSLILTGLAPSYAFALLTLFLVGGASSGYQTLNSALVLRTCDPLYTGRVMSLMMLAWGFSGIAGLPVGILADAVGERPTLVGMGIGVCVVVALVVSWSGRAAARRRQLATAPSTAVVAGEG